jgi:hypothetical protein
MKAFDTSHLILRAASAILVAVITGSAIGQENVQDNAWDVSNPLDTTLVGPNTWKPNQGPLPTVDAAVAKAVEGNPEVAAARARVALAEAELNAKRIEASRQILGLYSSLRSAEMQADMLKAKLQSASELLAFDKQKDAAGMAPASTENVIKRTGEVNELKTQLTQNASTRDEIEKELRMLLGSAPSLTFRSPAGATLALAGARHGSQMPQGPVVEKIRPILNEPTDLDFAGNPQPLKAVVDYISSRHKLPIYIHPSLDGSEILVDRTFKDVPLRYAFEGIQELTKGEVSFVVRDYGILVVPKDVAEQNGYASAIDFKGAPPARQPPAESAMSRGQSTNSTGQPTTSKPAADHDAPRGSLSRPGSEDPFGRPASSSVDHGGGAANKQSSASDPFGK